MPTVTYAANGATGAVPVDGTNYAASATVTVLGVGALTLTDGTFAYWCTTADATGTRYNANETFVITADTTLFAHWYVTTGLPNGGVGTHYKFSYDRSLTNGPTNPTGPEPARTVALMAVAEADYTLMRGWFGNIDIDPLIAVPMPIVVANAGGGAGCGGSFPNIGCTLKPGNGDVAHCRYLMVSEISEMFMFAQNRGWSAPDYSNEASAGEGLSRFLAQQFLVIRGLGVAAPGFQISGNWLNSSLPPGTAGSSQRGGELAKLVNAIDATQTTFIGTAAPGAPYQSQYLIDVDSEQMLVTAVDGTAKQFTVTRGVNGTTAAAHGANTQVFFSYGARTDYINTQLQYDHSGGAAAACSMLFLYYLRVQLGFSISQIVQAAPGADHAATCLRDVYRNLTNDNGDPFPFFKRLLDEAFPPGAVSNIPGPNPDNPWPIAKLTFVGVKDTWGRDECADILSASGGTYPNAFMLLLEGFNRQVAGSSTPVTPTVAFTGVTTALDPIDIAYESTNPLVPQRIRYHYDVQLANTVLAAFPASGETPALVSTSINILGKSFPGRTFFYFVAGANPYFTNVIPNADPTQENASWLSADLRVFTATPGIDARPVPAGPSFGTDSFAGAYQYIQALIGWLNTNFGDPAGVDPLLASSGVIPGQNDALTTGSSVTPSTTSGGTRHANYNFAIARVRLRGSAGATGAAQNVRVFFRMWGTETADTDWQPGSTYLSQLDTTTNLPRFPRAPSDNHTIPFFATSNTPALTSPTNPEYGPSGVNNRTITIAQGDKQWAYFGCFLNVYDPAFVVNGAQVNATLPGTHHCLVAEIAYDGAPIQPAPGATTTTENCDRLAQRNLQISASDNPGPADAHRVPQTFDTRWSRQIQGHVEIAPDELMIDWGETPVGSLASIYWPAADAQDVLDLASRLYGSSPLGKSDPHTVTCKTVAGVTYVPVPFGTGEGLAGLLTIELPQGVRAGDEHDVVVRRISTRRVRVPKEGFAARSEGFSGVDGDTIKAPLERYVVGSFQVRIGVTTSDVVRPADEDTLAILKARLLTLGPTNRWYPVLRRYIQILGRRVDVLGGHAAKIPPSLTGAPAPRRPPAKAPCDDAANAEEPASGGCERSHCGGARPYQCCCCASCIVHGICRTLRRFCK